MAGLLRPEAVGRRRERRAGRGELEGAHDAAAVVSVDGGGGRRIELGEPLVGERRIVVVDALPALALPRGRSRGQGEVGESGAEVEAGPPDDDRRPPGREDLVDRCLGQGRVLADGCLVVERPERHEPRGCLVREDRQAAVDLHCIGRYELGREALRQARSYPRFATGGRAEYADNRH